MLISFDFLIYWRVCVCLSLSLSWKSNDLWIIYSNQSKQSMNQMNWMQQCAIWHFFTRGKFANWPTTRWSCVSPIGISQGIFKAKITIILLQVKVMQPLFFQSNTNEKGQKFLSIPKQKYDLHWMKIILQWSFYTNSKILHLQFYFHLKCIWSNCYSV